MTTAFNNVALEFTPRPAAASPAEPGIVTWNEKQYKIKLEMLVDGVWKEIDTSGFSREEFESVMETCQKIYQTTTGENQSKSLTVYLQHNTLPESWTSTIIGNFLDSWKDKDLEKLEFVKLEYTTQESDKPEVLGVKTHKFEEAELMVVNLLAKEIAPIAKRIFSSPEQFVKDERTARPSKAELNNQKLQEVKQILKVQEAGSRENRCATLSIAAILLKKHSGDLQAAADEYRIPLVPNVGESKLMTLSNGLIELAAKTIETNDAFLQDGYFASVIAALTDAKQTILDEKNRPAIVKQYADYIRLSGMMADAPVFNALELHNINIITLVPDKGDLVLGSMSELISFDKEIDKTDLTSFCFIVRDGLHYQPVIMDKANTAQQEKLCSIFKRDMNQTLGQIQALITDQVPTQKQITEFNNLVMSVMVKYPEDAQPRIIQMLRAGRRSVESIKDHTFIGDAVNAFQTFVPKIEEVD